MKQIGSARLRVRILCAGVVMALCAACGPGGPKQDSDDDSDGTSSSGSISVLAGNATTAGSLNGTGGVARFNTPRGIVRDSAGNLFVADELNYVIRKITSAGVVTVFAGTFGIQDSIDGIGTDARFLEPTALAIDADDNVYVTDQMAIRKITPDAVVSTVTTLALGSNIASVSLDQFIPAGIAIDASNNLFVTTGIGTRRFPVSDPGNTINLEGALTQNNVTATRTLTPRGITVDSSGNAYLANLDYAINKISAGSTARAAYAGTDGQAGSTNDAATNARFQQVVGLALDDAGNLYAADAGNNAIRKITPNLNVTTEAGTVGSSTLSTGNLPGSLAEIRGIASDGGKTLYVTSGNAVVKIVLP